MEPFDTTAAQIRWAARSLALQLSHIPDDKLDWKPDPAAKSVLEMVGEATSIMRMMLPVFRGGDEWRQAPFLMPRTRDEALAQIRDTAEEYARALEAVAPGDLKHSVRFPFGVLSAEWSVNYPLIDLIHHHGQVCYIQSLLGDGETHFDRQAALDLFGARDPG